MSKTVHVQSASDFEKLIKSSKTVLVDFYADWCGPCKTIAPFFEQLAAKHSRPNLVTFAKVNTDNQQDVARKYGITAMPTFLLFSSGAKVEETKGANPKALESLANKAAKLADEGSAAGGSGSSAAAGGDGTTWLGASLPRGYTDVTDQVEIRGLDLLNADSDFGTVRSLFEAAKPSSLSSAGKGKGKAAAGDAPATGKDWVESDTDEQLMLFVPFQSSLKIHSVQITSLPPYSDDEESDETPTRPAEIRLYTNRAHNLGFEEAEDTVPAQTVTLSKEQWDEETGTATLELRFVKFQNVSSLVIFVVGGEREGAERTRVDRVRILGESGAKRDMGKLEKVGDEE